MITCFAAVMNLDAGKFIGPAPLRISVPLIDREDNPSYLSEFQILKPDVPCRQPRPEPRCLVIPVYNQVFNADIGSRVVYRNNGVSLVWLDDDCLAWSTFDSRHLSRRVSAWGVVETLIIRSTLDNQGISGRQTVDALRNRELGL